MLRPDMKAIRTQINFDKTRMITAHSNRLIGMLNRSPLMRFGESRSSGLDAFISSENLVTGLTTRSSRKAPISSVPECIVIHPLSVVVFMMAPIYAKDQPDTGESNSPIAHQVNAQGNSNKALKIIKITAQTQRTIGIVISISFMGLGRIRSSKAHSSTFFVMTHFSSRSLVYRFLRYASNIPPRIDGKLYWRKRDTYLRYRGVIDFTEHFSS